MPRQGKRFCQGRRHGERVRRQMRLFTGILGIAETGASVESPSDGGRRFILDASGAHGNGRAGEGGRNAKPRIGVAQRAEPGGPAAKHRALPQ